MLARLFKQNHDLAILFIRLAFGLVFFVFGWLHVAGLEGYINAFADRFNMPLPNITAPLVAWVELLGGLAAIVGIFTRYAGLLLAITMLVSTLAVRLPEGLAEGRDPLGLIGHWDLDLLLFAIGMALMVVGPGKYALEQKIWKREI